MYVFSVCDVMCVCVFGVFDVLCWFVCVCVCVVLCWFVCVGGGGELCVWIVM